MSYAQVINPAPSLELCDDESNDGDEERDGGGKDFGDSVKCDGSEKLDDDDEGR